MGRFNLGFVKKLTVVAAALIAVVTAAPAGYDDYGRRLPSLRGDERTHGDRYPHWRPRFRARGSHGSPDTEFNGAAEKSNAFPYWSFSRHIKEGQPIPVWFPKDDARISHTYPELSVRDHKDIAREFAEWPSIDHSNISPEFPEWPSIDHSDISLEFPEWPSIDHSDISLEFPEWPSIDHSDISHELPEWPSIDQLDFSHGFPEWPSIDQPDFSHKFPENPFKTLREKITYEHKENKGVLDEKYVTSLVQKMLTDGERILEVLGCKNTKNKMDTTEQQQERSTFQPTETPQMRSSTYQPSESRQTSSPDTSGEDPTTSPIHSIPAFRNDDLWQSPLEIGMEWKPFLPEPVRKSNPSHADSQPWYSKLWSGYHW